MAVATVAELTEHLAEYLELVELGGRVIVRNGDETVAEIVPTPKAQYLLTGVLAELPPEDAHAAQTVFLGDGAVDQAVMSMVKESRERVQNGDAADPQAAIKARLAQMVAEGKARPPLAPLPDDFFTEPRPKFEGGSVLEELLAERRESKR